jgi:hypothetical protein
VTYADFDLAAQPLTTARSINTGANATTALSSIDGAINQISNARATWGAAMNRLVHAGDNAANVSMNLTESNSRIVDTDYAQTTAELARSMILNEAGSALLRFGFAQLVTVFTQHCSRMRARHRWFLLSLATYWHRLCLMAWQTTIGKPLPWSPPQE